MAPDAIGGTSRQYSRPSIYLYGSIELWFAKSPPWGLTSIFWEAGEKGALRLPSICKIEDWALAPGMHRDDIQAYLRENGLTFTVKEPSGYPTLILVPGGARISLDEDARLGAIYIPLEKHDARTN